MSQSKSDQKHRLHAPTVSEIASDQLTVLADRYWSPVTLTQLESKPAREPFDAAVVEDLYYNEIQHISTSRLMLLELSCYLENFLWPNFDPTKATFAHVMSIITLVNEKFRESVPAWSCFHQREELFKDFFEHVLNIKTTRPNMTTSEKTSYLLFFINCFQSLEDDMVRKECLKLVSLPLWYSLNEGRRELELRAAPELRQPWANLEKREKKAKAEGKSTTSYAKTFLPGLIKEFVDMLSSITTPKTVSSELSLYCERFLELMIDLIAQLPTRRFFRVVLEDSHLYVKCKQSTLVKLTSGRLFSQLLDMLKFYLGFEINDQTGTALTNNEMLNIHSSKVLALQRVAFKYFTKLRDLALSNLSNVETRNALTNWFVKLTDEELLQLAQKLRLAGQDAQFNQDGMTREFLTESLVLHHEKRVSQIDAINEMPLYPNETILWDENLVPTANYNGESVLALPKLNLQFLTFHDYLLRNYNLFRLESTYEIREDLQDAIRRMNPRRDEYHDATEFQGWARMALPVGQFKIVRVNSPHVGENKPSKVKAEVTYDIGSLKSNIRSEWEGIRQHDILFLVTIQARVKPNEKLDDSLPFYERFGVKYVRGCEVAYQQDADGNRFTGVGESDVRLHGGKRILRLHLDTAQYQLDHSTLLDKQKKYEQEVRSLAGTTSEQPEEIYSTFNLIMRRKPKENNFKAILETIRDLMNAQSQSQTVVVPDWLHDVFLGYGDPASATYENMPADSRVKTVDFKDTILDLQHLRDAFPGKTLKFSSEDESKWVAPFKVTFPTPKADEEDDDDSDEDEAAAAAKKKESEPLLVEPYTPLDPGPYPQDQPKKNQIRFTPVQMEAIVRGVNPGLTLVVGPPGTGKTDVAVQIISNIYHNFPNQRTLIVTHSNQALNDLFEKIMLRDIRESHLLRLGFGAGDLDTDKDYSKFGRVNYMLKRRLELLDEVDRLAKSLRMSDDAAYTCETAAHFYLKYIVSRVEQFRTKMSRASEAEKTVALVRDVFPFIDFFQNVAASIFKGQSFAEDLRAVEGCFRHLETLFTELEECRAFEVLKSSKDRGNYLLTRQAKIIAMTCTHAALKRRDLVEMGFQYDNLLMEEAAQILEIETFIPMLLQTPDNGKCRLKRVVLIGDHHQLPPVVKNQAFQKYSHLDQSLFTRFIRLQVPHVQLNFQGRMRSALAELYRWRYKSLGDLPIVQSGDFTTICPGLTHDYQFINVENYQGIGESEPNPHFYQNLGEAEYVAALYQYLRLCGYPASRISVITTYNGQKYLLRDVLTRRCASNPLLGLPSKITTVDKFQGQQNDIVLLSLVRTKAVGHIRDVRRLVVAMSRARFGLYVFGRRSLFENCYELTPVFKQLLQRPLKLSLQPNETFPDSLANSLTERPQPIVMNDVIQMGQYVHKTLQERTLVLQQQQQHLRQQRLAAAAVAAATNAAANAIATTSQQQQAGVGGDSILGLSPLQMLNRNRRQQEPELMEVEEGDAQDRKRRKVEEETEDAEQQQEAASVATTTTTTATTTAAAEVAMDVEDGKQ